MKRIIALGGEHLTGKSTLLCAALEDYFMPTTKPFTYALLKGYVNYENRLVVLGTYAPESISGVDGLSKDVLADAVAFIENMPAIFQHADQMTVVFEGTRLFDTRFLLTCRAQCPDTRLLILKTTRDILDKRNSDERNISQSEKRRTRSIVYKVGASLGARYLINDNEADLETNRVALRKIIGL